MIITNELKVVNNTQYNQDIRENFVSILESIVEQIIQDKNIFNLEDFSAIYYDEFTLKTNCHEEIYNTLYLEVNQPNNYKPTKIITKKNKDNTIHFPELYYPLDSFKQDLYDYIMKTLDSNNIVWLDEYSICIKSVVNIDDKPLTYYYRIIPCLTYYNSNNTRGIIYKKNNGIEIEYPEKSIQNFSKKNKATKNLYRDIVLIFKNLLLKEKNIKTLPREIIEIMIYNVPNELIKDDKISTMLNIINYVRNNSIKQFKTLDEEDLAFISKYRSLSLLYVKHILKILEKQLTA